MNFLHFAVLLFAVSVVLLVGVSLATAPAPLAKLRGLTFATLESDYIPASERSQSLFRIAPRLDDRARGFRRGVVGVFRLSARRRKCGAGKWRDVPVWTCGEMTEVADLKNATELTE